MQTLATVHLVRHGEVHNPDRVLYGRLPEFGLSELGHEMARGVAAWFEERAAQTGRAPAVVAASPLTRAQQTAAPIAAAFDLPLVTEPDLIEAENAFEGMSQVAASLKRNPRLWPRLRNPLRPSWGEPYRAQAARMLAVVDRLRGETVAADGPGPPRPGRHGSRYGHEDHIPITSPRLHGRAPTSSVDRGGPRVPPVTSPSCSIRPIRCRGLPCPTPPSAPAACAPS